MLKNIIIPEKIGSYFLFPLKIIGFELNKNFVRATQINVSAKRNVKIEKFIEEKLSLNEITTYNEKASYAINNVLSKTKKYDYIKITLPAYLAIFKELTFPFTDIDKIRSVLEFEVEPILPFPIDEAVTDFIVTKTNKASNSTTILAAIARKKDILELIEPFRAIGINPSSIVVDVIGLFGICNPLIYNELKESEGNILIDIEFNYSNIMYIQDGQLKLVRSLNQGISNIIKKFSDSINIEFDRAHEYINKYGVFEIENEEYSKAIDNAMSDFYSNIAFTLSSFKTLLPGAQDIKKITLIGQGVEIKNLDKYISSKVNLTCNQITIANIIESNQIKSNQKITNAAVLSLSTAYPSSINENFNLLKKELEITEEKLLKKQIFTSLILILLILGTLFGYSYRQIKKLKNEINTSRTQLINALKNTFEITDPAILRNLSEVINAANTKVNEEENIWFSFSNQARFSILKYLQELSTIIDKDAIGLNLKRLTISEGLITLEGEVKDFKGLEILENELNESKLFSHVTVPQETKFTIKLTIKKDEESI